MKSNRYNLWNQEEYDYPMAFGFIPNLVSYIHDEDDAPRPCIIIVPGGGYCAVSPTEGELVALKFYEKGYNAFVCTYTTNLLKMAPLKLQPLRDLSRAIRFVRKEAEQFHISPEKIIICGFSAGGHLCASVCVHYEDVKDESEEYVGISNRPNAAILSYPVITAGEKGHKDSFEFLLGIDATEEELHYMSVEKHIKGNTPPCFLWHTVTDELVPVENSLLFSEACKEKGVKYALHIFSEGPHGLSLANQDWADGNFGIPYTAEQLTRIIEKAKSGEIPIPQEITAMFASFEEQGKVALEKNKPNEEVAIWSELATQWLKMIL